jgi:hypothetical protein
MSDRRKKTNRVDSSNPKEWKKELPYYLNEGNKYDDYSLKKLRDTQKVISADSRSDRLVIENPNFDSPFDVLSAFLVTGEYPPPEILIVISKIYQSYMDGEGSISLEEAFFGKPKKGVGTYSARRANREKGRASIMYSEFHKRVTEQPDTPQVDLACELKEIAHSALERFGAYLNHGVKPDDPKEKEKLDALEMSYGYHIVGLTIFADITDEDSFIRGYRRWMQRDTMDK